MSNFQWTLLIFGLFLLASLTWWRRAWKDMWGAMQIAAGIVLLAALVLVVGCSVSPERRPWMEAGVAYDTQHTVGSDPACIVRVRQPIVPGRVIAGYTHHSSCGDLADRNTVDQIEVMAVIPLGREK